MAVAIVGSKAEAASRDESCAVVASAFSTGLAVPNSYPKAVRPSRPSSPDGELGRKLEVYLRGTQLTALEIADLKRQAVGHAFTPYAPACRGLGQPAAVVETSQTMVSEFTRPLFSSNGKIAVVAWSLFSTGRWGHGFLCVARKSGAVWESTCGPTWIA